MTWARLARDYAKSAKPRAIEGIGDIYLIRPLGFLLVEGFRRTPATPTFVSILAVLAGWVCAACYYASVRQGMVPALALAGALTMLLHSALDSADGQLARLLGRSTPLGRIIDGLCDNLAFGAIYVAICLGHWSRDQRFPLGVVALALLAGLSHSIQSSLVEYARTLYLQCVHGGRDLADARAAAHTRRRDTGSTGWLLLGLHGFYYRQQRAVLRSTDRLERVVAAWLTTHPHRSQALAERYEASHRRLLRYWTLFASNSHKLGIVVAGFIPAWPGDWGLGLGMAWYFVYVLALNLAAPFLLLAQARADARLISDLGALAAFPLTDVRGTGCRA
jgi:phosphatidylglycerophosphate synthase